MELEQKIYLANLYEIYYLLFTKRQQEIIDFYLDEDYTISEIADILNISLAGVSKTITEAKKKLLFLEESLEIYKTYNHNIQLLKKNKIDQKIIKKLK